MTITVDLRPEIQVELARQAAAHGSAIEAYAASLLEEAVNPAAGTNRLPFDKQRAQAAGARIRELRKGFTLGGLTIRELIDERSSVSRFVLDNTVTMAWCFADEATEFTETVLHRLSNLIDSAMVPACGCTKWST